MAAAVTVWTQSESIWLFLGSYGVLVWLVGAPPKRWTGEVSRPRCCRSVRMEPRVRDGYGIDAGRCLPSSARSLRAGAFVFGSGLAIVPFLYAGVVHDHQWLTERQFVDAVAVAMITPRASSSPWASSVI